ncbi:uncharacterized protein [Amphiura filiformis]|uniref:uncharacterized protein n=1 Tax=Amphiura filiformis TaxID=82378 RepID=UPI003B21C1CC
MSTPDKSQLIEVMWLEPEKDYGKYSLARRHQIIADYVGVRNDLRVGKDVLVMWGRGKNSTYYMARITSLAADLDTERIRTKSEDYFANRMPQKRKSKRKNSEGTESVQSSSSRTSDNTKSRQSEETESLQSSPSTSGDDVILIETATNNSGDNCQPSSDHEITIIETSNGGDKCPPPSNHDITLIRTITVDKSQQTESCVAPKTPITAFDICAKPAKTTKTDSDSVFLDSSKSPDDKDSTIIQDHERRRHTDLRLRFLKDAEHQLDHCIRMLRGLFHVVPELHQRLHGRSLPRTSCRRPATDLESIKARQSDFERRSSVFYQVVQGISELRSDPRFTRWIADAIRKSKN